MVMREQKNVVFSVKTRLLAAAILPVIVIGVVLTFFSAGSIRQGMQEEAFKGLRGIALSVQEIYDSVDSGDYAQDASGIVTKGGLVVSNNYEYTDRLKSETGYEVTLFYGDTRVATSLVDNQSGGRLVGTKASDVVISEVLRNQKEYSDDNIQINGLSYYGYYVPIIQGGSAVGMVFAGLPSGEVNEYINQRIMVIAGICTAILAAVLAIIVWVSTSLARGIRGAEHAILELGKGNLNVTVDPKARMRRDEIGSMTRELEALISELTTIIGNVKKSSKILYESGNSLEEMAIQTSASTDEISHAIEEISKSAASQADEVETASESIGNMGEVITEIVGSVEELGKTSMQMKSANDESTVIIKKLSESNDRTTQAIEKIGHQVHVTNDSVQMIRQAVELITSIADETSLLSLNASIEAARAGEHGRGFAVVASQIQKLAEESNASAGKIEDIIDGLLKESEAAVLVMEEVDEIIREQREKLEETRVKFKDVTSGVDATRGESEIIENQTAACDVARERIVDVISNLSAISEENAANTEETNASMEELNATISLLTDSARNLKELSEGLEKDMNFFQI